MTVAGAPPVRPSGRDKPSSKWRLPRYSCIIYPSPWACCHDDSGPPLHRAGRDTPPVTCELTCPVARRPSVCLQLPGPTTHLQQLLSHSHCAQPRADNLISYRSRYVTPLSLLLGLYLKYYISRWCISLCMNNRIIHTCPQGHRAHTPPLSLANTWASLGYIQLINSRLINLKTKNRDHNSPATEVVVST